MDLKILRRIKLDEATSPITCKNEGPKENGQNTCLSLGGFLLWCNFVMTHCNLDQLQIISFLSLCNY